jgi:DNA polymerase
LREAAESCHGCDLYREATQTVFGAGPARADLMMVGEEPGDKEDVAGEPFVGPAGRVLDRALAEAGIDRASVYLTNAVKHFKFTRPERGKTRLHKKPTVGEIRACFPWLEAELAAVRPQLVVCLGATAARALLGPDFRVTRQRGAVMELPERRSRFLATVHPSAVLRADDREEAFAAFLKDLKAAATELERTA